MKDHKTSIDKSAYSKLLKNSMLFIAAVLFLLGCSHKNAGSPSEQVQLAVLEDCLKQDSSTVFFIGTDSSSWAYISKALAGRHLPIKPFNECFIAKDLSIRDKQTQKKGEIIELETPIFTSSDHATCGVMENVGGNLGQSGDDYELIKKNGKWVVIEVKFVWAT